LQRKIERGRKNFPEEEKIPLSLNVEEASVCPPLIILVSSL